MPAEGMPDSRAALERAGLIKPAAPAPAPAVPAQPVTPPPAAPVVTPDPATPPAAPEFTGIPQPRKEAPVPPGAPNELPPETIAANLPQAAQIAFKKQRETIATLEKKLETAGKSNDEAKIKEYEQKLAQAYDQIAELDLVKDPRFQAAFEVPKQKLVGEMKTVLEQYGIDADTVISGLKGKTFEDQIAFLRENASDARVEVAAILREINKIDDSRHEMLKNKDIAKQQILARQNEAEKHLTVQAFDIVFKSEADAGEQLLREIPGEDAFNQNVAKLKAFAMTLDDSTPMARAKLKTDAAQKGIYKSLYQTAMAQAAAYEKQLRAFGKGLPDTTGSRPDSTIPTGTPDRMTPAEAAKRIASRM